MDTSLLAAVAADLISDRLRDLLLEAGELYLEDGHLDTTLARQDGDALVVELVQLNDGARTRDDGRRILRIVVEEVR